MPGLSAMERTILPTPFLAVHSLQETFACSNWHLKVQPRKYPKTILFHAVACVFLRIKCVLRCSMEQGDFALRNYRGATYPVTGKQNVNM